MSMVCYQSIQQQIESDEKESEEEEEKKSSLNRNETAPAALQFLDNTEEMNS